MKTTKDLVCEKIEKDIFALRNFHFNQFTPAQDDPLHELRRSEADNSLRERSIERDEDAQRYSE